MPAPLLGTLGWPFQASPFAYSFDEKSSALVPIHPFPSAKDVHEFLRLYCSENDNLVVSPYTSPSHTLDLNTLEIPQQLMAKALTLMASLRPDYALIPYSEAFNWSTVINALDVLAREHNFRWTRQEFYIIVFRSQLVPTADYFLLGEMDERSHVEATKSGGLLKYWFGEPDAEGHNLATCIWRHRNDTVGGSAGESHKQAMKATMRMFSKWNVERKMLVVDDNVAGYRFEDFKA